MLISSSLLLVGDVVTLTLTPARILRWALFMCSTKAPGLGKISSHIVHFFLWSTLEIEMEPLPRKALGMLTRGGAALGGGCAGADLGGGGCAGAAGLGCLCIGLP